MKKVREKVAIAVAIASITTISSFVISNGKKVYAEEVRVTATANVDNIKGNGKQLKDENPNVNTQEDKNVKNKKVKTDGEKDVKEVESNFVKNDENKTEKISKDKSLEKKNDNVSTKLGSSDKDVKEIKNDKDIKDKDSKEVKDENAEKVHNNKKDTVKEVENKADQNNEDKINKDKNVEVKSDEIKTKDNETSQKDGESKKIEEKIEVGNKESESKLDKNEALKSDYININEDGQAVTTGTESQNNSVTDENKKDGWQTIGGKTYYFDSNSGMATMVKEINNGSENKIYLFDKDGILVKGAGWKEANERWYYLNSDNSLLYGWQTINGKKYYLDKYNGMAKGLSCVNINDNYEVYLFNEDGSLVTGSGWKQIDGKWYYFNNNNSLVNGWKTINGKTYYFSSNMSIGPTLIQGNRPEKVDLYYFGEDGELINRKGWTKLNDNWFYFNDDSSLKTKWQTIGGKTYYFNETTGAMVTGKKTIYDYFNHEEKIYCFTSDGVLLKGKGWFSKYDEYNNYKKVWCYIDENGVLKTGCQIINGKDYYFYCDGKMATGIVNVEGVTGNPKFYYFDNNGELFKKEGWKKMNEKWYYLNEDGSLANEWKKLGSDWYYLNPNYGMAIGPTKVQDDMCLGINVYYFEEDGRLTNRTGWINHINGEFSDWYYVENGGKAALGWNKINGTWYYFDSDAKMVTAPTRIFDKDSSKDKIYFFDKNGAYRRYSGWYELKPVDGETCWYYFGEDGLAKTGWQTINGNKYWFAPNGIMCKGISTIFENEVEDGCYKVDLPTYLFNESGALVTSEGWHKVTLYDGDKWCYIDNTGVCKK